MKIHRNPWTIVAFTAALTAAADAAMVTARWGIKGRVQHPNALAFAPAAGKTTLMTVDLSALPPGAPIYRGRLFFHGVNWKQKGFDIVPAARGGGGEQALPKAAGKRLEVVGPWNQWLDATEAVRGWVREGARSGLFWMRSGRSFDRDRTVLEIAYEGKPAGTPPPQVTGVQAACRSGQVFVTFKEVDPPDGGKEQVTIGELAGKMSADYYRVLPHGRLSYQVYRHDEPITAANLGRAELLGEVFPGSAYNTRFAFVAEGRQRGMAAAQIAAKASPADALAVRLATEPGEALAPSTGLYVHTVRKPGRACYAVVTADEGVANTTDISEANTAGPVEQRVAAAEPVLYKQIVTPLRDAKYHEQWYSFWTAAPASPVPARYDVVVWFCPGAMGKPAPLQILRYGWNSWPRPPLQRSKTDGIGMAHTADQPVDFRLGLHDSIGTIKGFDQGVWQPFFIRRQAALVKWMLDRWPIDPNRIRVSMGAWGMMELKHGETYALIQGWGEPEITKGFQCWNRARGIWGEPELYAGRPDQENPFAACDFTAWVLANPQKELPFFHIHAGGGAHYTEMGWPPFPKFCWAMMQAKQPFVFSTARSPVAGAAERLAGRRDRSVPAFGNCTLDDNLGDGDIHSGNGWNNSQVNGYVMWDPQTLVDQPGVWEITIWVDESSFHPDCTVDLTPRRCQRFRAKPGERFGWTNTTRNGQEAVQSGAATADDWGLVTMEKVIVSKGGNRIRLTRAG